MINVANPDRSRGLSHLYGVEVKFHGLDTRPICQDWSDANRRYLMFGFSRLNPPEESTLTHGTFDVSERADVCESIRSLLGPAEATLISSKVYFEGRYAGVTRESWGPS